MLIMQRLRSGWQELPGVGKSKGNELIEHALNYARAGFRVLPCHPNAKAPAIQKWQELATWDEATVRKWWTEKARKHLGLVANRRPVKTSVAQRVNRGDVVDGWDDRHGESRS